MVPPRLDCCRGRRELVPGELPRQADSHKYNDGLCLQIRLYSRDLELSNQNVLHREILTSPVVVLSLVDNSLLVYTADNTLYHYLIIPTAETIKLHQCGSISFDGVISVPAAVRSLSWMVPNAQKREQLGYFVQCPTYAKPVV